ncbi:MAG TPA: hypothetical protein PK337_11095 [Bacteroidia bacterium]|nr:hypothetical protein [Bacteroidia bacterium]
MKKLFTLLTALALGSLTSNAQLIYDNGSIVNQPGAGAVEPMFLPYMMG